MRERDRIFKKCFSVLPMCVDAADLLRIIRLPEVIRRTCKSRSSIYEDLQKCRFPRPVSVGKRSKGWIENEVALWVVEKMRERGQSLGRQIPTIPMPSDRTHPKLPYSHAAHAGK